MGPPNMSAMLTMAFLMVFNTAEPSLTFDSHNTASDSEDCCFFRPGSSFPLSNLSLFAKCLASGLSELRHFVAWCNSGLVFHALQVRLLTLYFLFILLQHGSACRVTKPSGCMCTSDTAIKSVSNAIIAWVT